MTAFAAEHPRPLGCLLAHRVEHGRPELRGDWRWRWERCGRCEAYVSCPVASQEANKERTPVPLRQPNGTTFRHDRCELVTPDHGRTRALPLAKVIDTLMLFADAVDAWQKMTHVEGRRHDDARQGVARRRGCNEGSRRENRPDPPPASWSTTAALRQPRSRWACRRAGPGRSRRPAVCDRSVHPSRSATPTPVVGEQMIDRDTTSPIALDVSDVEARGSRRGRPWPRPCSMPATRLSRVEACRCRCLTRLTPDQWVGHPGRCCKERPEDPCRSRLRACTG